MWEPRMLWGQTVEVRAKSVSVSEASTSERRLIECLMQFYIYEFMWPSSSIHIECDDQNRCPPFADLNRYWRIEGFHPLLIRVEGRLAGFALINTHSRHGEKIELNMAEFFIAREHRGRGVATEAVRLILAQYPGRWEIAVAEHNVAAKMFWSRTLAATPNVGRLVRLEGDGKRWRGPIWSFQSASSDVRCAEDELTEQPLRLSDAPSARQVSLF